MPSTAEREIVSTRVLNHPQDKVFNAFKTPELLARWWGPDGFSNTFETFDFTPGGAWDFIMHGPDGTHYPNKSVFVEIAAPERIVFDHIVAPVFRMAITCEKLGEQQTRFGFRMTFESAEVCEGVKAICGPANEQNFDRLEAVLASC